VRSPFDLGHRRAVVASPTGRRRSATAPLAAPWSPTSASRQRSPEPASWRPPAPRCARSERSSRLRATDPSAAPAGIQRPWPGCSGAPADRLGGAAGDLTAPRQPRMSGTSPRSRIPPGPFVVDGAASRPTCTTMAWASRGLVKPRGCTPRPPLNPSGPAELVPSVEQSFERRCAEWGRTVPSAAPSPAPSARSRACSRC
jgi:hypothetical protein